MLATNVHYGHYYSLVYNSMNNLLEDCIYKVDFIDWIKAGIAYNTRAIDLPTRKVSNFAELYSIVENGEWNSNKQLIEVFLIYFYEDLLYLLSKHTHASIDPDLLRGRKRNPRPPTHPAIIPVFNQCTWIYNMFNSVKPVSLETSEEINSFREISIDFSLADGATFTSMCQLYDAIMKKGVLIYE